MDKLTQMHSSSVAQVTVTCKWHLPTFPTGQY